jgi:hypothetical protein
MIQSTDERPTGSSFIIEDHANQSLIITNPTDSFFQNVRSKMFDKKKDIQNGDLE